MLAICERAAISECVSDVLVARGDGVVRHAIVGNPGARFSPATTASLIEICRSDHALSDLLGSRGDLSTAHRRHLIEIARIAAHRRLGRLVPAGRHEDVSAAVDRGAGALEAAFATGEPAVPDGLLGGLEPGETAIAALAEAGRREAAIEALASLAGLSLHSIETIFAAPDNDLLLIIGKALGWQWRTVRSLLHLRNPGMRERHHFRRAGETFEGLSSDTARRVLHFLRIRDQAGLSAGLSGGRP